MTAYTPSHCTKKPRNEVVRGASTPHAAVVASPTPDHPFESTNPYTSLRSSREGSPDDRSGSCRLEDLLMPGDLLPPSNGSVIALPDDITTLVSDPPVTDIYQELHGSHPALTNVLRVWDLQLKTLMNDWDTGLKAQLDDRNTSMITKLDNHFQ